MSLKIASKTKHFHSFHEKNGMIHENASNTHYKKESAKGVNFYAMPIQEDSFGGGVVLTDHFSRIHGITRS
jgi:hypothetical protein